MSRLYEALSAINKAIVRTTTRDDLFLAVCRALTDHGGFRLAWVGWHEPVSRTIAPVAVFGEGSNSIRAVPLYAADPRDPVVTAFVSKRPCIRSDAHSAFPVCASFPVRFDNAVSGTLSVLTDRRDDLRDEEIGLLEEAAADLSFALDNFAREEARRQAERMLRDERVFTDVMIESMPGALYFYDTSGRFLRWNRNFETISGYSADEISAMHPLDFFRGDDKARVEERIQEVFEQGESSIEAGFVTRDDRSLPYFFTGRRVEFDGRICLVGVGIDISDRRDFEARLIESERKYRELVEHANSIILRWTSTGHVTFLNEYGQRFFGYSADEIIGRHVTGTIVPETESSGRDLQRLMDEICAAPEAFEQNTNENIRRDGERVWIAWTNRVQFDASGKVLEILSIGTDVTEQRRAGEERARRERAETADRIKSAFLATMSHELRTPLNSIIGFTGIILQGMAGPLNEEQARQLEMVRGSARHLLALVNDVLDISKIEAGQFEVGHAPFDLRESIVKVIGLVQPQVADKKLAFRIDIPEAPGVALGDQRRFEQILLNLLSNAIKFTPAGEIELSVSLIDDYQPPGAAEPRRAVRLRVSDTGIGIRAADLSELFQPFRQIDAGISRNHEGTGLGLAICHRLTELMGGEIGAQSEWGKGSIFSVTLPLQGPEPS